MPDRIEELLVAPERALDLAPHEARRLLVRVAPLIRALELAAVESHNGHDPEGNKLVSAEQLAEITAQPRRWFYSMARRKDWEPFTLRVSRGKLLFKLAGVVRWLAEHGNGR